MYALRAVTLELLRRRAEHNDRELLTLEEITLHQYDLESIELLETACPRLRILYLQNNQISRIENLGRLKYLEYLNLALNNIKCIENLQGCESLRKLDLTLNFIDDLNCVASLRACGALRELFPTTNKHRFLTGCPVATHEFYRETVTATLEHLTQLDGKEILPSDRIRARRHNLHQPSPENVTHRLSGESSVPPPQRLTDEIATELDRIERMAPDEAAHDFQTTTTTHTPASRLAGARQMSVIRGTPAAESGAPPPLPPDAYGRVLPSLLNVPAKTEIDSGGGSFAVTRRAGDAVALQHNHAMVAFRVMAPAPHLRVLEVDVSRHVATELLQIVVETDAVRVCVRRKDFQLRFDPAEHVEAGLAVAQRSQASGILTIYMVLLGRQTSDDDALEHLQVWRRRENFNTIKRRDGGNSRRGTRFLPDTTNDDDSKRTEESSLPLLDSKSSPPSSLVKQANETVGEKDALLGRAGGGCGGRGRRAMVISGSAVPLVPGHRMTSFGNDSLSSVISPMASTTCAGNAHGDKEMLAFVDDPEVPPLL